MRTEAEVKANIATIREAKESIRKQIALFEDCQPIAIGITGERAGSWDELAVNLKQAWRELNDMYKMEVNYLNLLRGE